MNLSIPPTQTNHPREPNRLLIFADGYASCDSVAAVFLTQMVLGLTRLQHSAQMPLLDYVPNSGIPFQSSFVHSA
jgi:hypothetical protein